MEEINLSDFSGDYLKALDVKDKEQEFAVTDVSKESKDNKAFIVLHLESGELQKKFTLNKTNIKIFQEAGCTSGADMIGKIITFKKVQVNNPITNQPVEALRVVVKN